MSAVAAARGDGEFDLIATAAAGTEAVVKRELAALGYDARGTVTGRLAFRGDASAICRANLWLRSGERVLIQMGSFAATDFGQLFDGVAAIPWERWLPRDAEFPVSGRSHRSQLSSVPACQRIVKRAIVKRLMESHGVSELPETGPRFAIEVSLCDDVATLTLDTTGVGLHKRGYRSLVAEAQIRETLAATMVQLSFWRPGRVLADPFCGTGTIPIEAALLGRNMAPGLKREFACEAWPTFDAGLWKRAREEARDLARPALEERLLGYDVDGNALSLARYHAEQAGVAADIHWQQRPFSELRAKAEYGCIVTNPPYGERMSASPEVTELYRSFPLVFRRLPTWSFYILSARLDLEQLVGQQADRRRKLYNGPIECVYYQFHGPRPGMEERGARSEELGIGAKGGKGSAEGGVAEDKESRRTEEQQSSRQEKQELESSVDIESAERGGDEGKQIGRTEEQQSSRVEEQKQGNRSDAERDGNNRHEVLLHAPAFGGLRAEAARQVEEFANRLRKRARHLRRFPKRGVTCYRLYERDVPEVPLVIDRYEEALHVAEFVRPHERTPAEHADWLDVMVKTAGEVLEVPREQIFFKRRERQRGTAQYERVDRRESRRVVQEGGLKFVVNLSDYVDTGLFLDHRLTRQMVREAAAGKRFLNLFGYTGAFTVYAAAGGATSTTTVDKSAPYLDWARENLELNGFSGPEHELVRSDIREFVGGLSRRDEWDLVVVDPPTFSNTKGADEFWETQRDHAELLVRLAGHVPAGGAIFFSTNFRRFKLDEAALAEAYTIRDITRQTIPEDFRNERIHKCWRLVRR